MSNLYLPSGISVFESQVKADERKRPAEGLYLRPEVLGCIGIEAI